MSVCLCTSSVLLMEWGESKWGLRPVCEGGPAASRGARASCVFAAGVGGWGLGGEHSSSIWEVTRKDNKLPPQGPWGYESKAVLGDW